MRGDLLLLLADGLVILCLARFVLNRAELDARHPLMVFCTQVTDWLVKPFRKTITVGKWDWSFVWVSLLLYYVAFMLITFIALPGGFSVKIIAANLVFAIISLLKAAAYIIVIGAVLRMVQSFNNPYSPLQTALHRVFMPLSRPFAFLRIGRYDFSGSVVVLIVWIWLTWFVPQIMSRLNMWLLQ